MCDTMVALGNSTEDGSVLFAKNSDRQANEPHIMIRIPAQKHDTSKEKYIQATYINVPQVEETYEVVLLKPSWIWGCEMGWNEHGLNMGNEAVFTREKAGKPSLIGMDFMRLALERCKTSLDALNMITGLLDEFGQGGNCGFEKPFMYDNSFLLADKHDAWVLETAGKYWVAKQVRDFYCISNRLSIEKDYDKCHPDTVKHAMDMGWCRNEREFNFAGCYSNKLYTRLSGSAERRETCESILRNAGGKINVSLLKSALRRHDRELDGKLFKKKSLKSVCMHGGGIIGDHTTGSYIASLNDKICTYRVTGASTPCISVFKPLWMSSDMPVFSEPRRENAISYWNHREHLHRLILQGGADLVAYIKDRDELEEGIESLISGIQGGMPDDGQLNVAMEQAFEMEDRFVNRYLKVDSDKPLRVEGGPYYRYYWKHSNKGLS